MAKKVTVIDKRSTTAIEAAGVRVGEYFMSNATGRLFLRLSEKLIDNEVQAFCVGDRTRTNVVAIQLVLPVNVVITIVGDE